MRIASNNSESTIPQNLSSAKATPVESPKQTKTDLPKTETTKSAQKLLEQQDSKVEEKVDEAIESLNELLELNNKTSKFVKHEGLDKYFVRLVDAETEEVIKEIPPERLLNAFYEMQKLVGMIVDEKI